MGHHTFMAAFMVFKSASKSEDRVGSHPGILALLRYPGEMKADTHTNTHTWVLMRVLLISSEVETQMPTIS